MKKSLLQQANRAHVTFIICLEFNNKKKIRQNSIKSHNIEINTQDLHCFYPVSIVCIHAIQMRLQ